MEKSFMKNTLFLSVKETLDEHERISKLFSGFLLLFTIFLINSISAEESIAGFYYFKGLSLLEIKVEGNKAIAHLNGEDDFDRLSKNTPQPILAAAAQSAKGNEAVLISPAKAEFANIALNSPENFMQLLGLDKSKLSEEHKKQFEDMINKAPADKDLHYIETWELMQGGKLKIASSLPVLNPCWGIDTEKTLKAVESMRDNIKNAFGSYELVCAWKIKDVKEIQAWQAIDAGDFTKASQLFVEVAAAEPNNPFCCFGAVHAYLGLKDFQRAKNALQLAKSKINDETRPFLNMHVFRANDLIFTYENAERGQSAQTIIDSLAAGTANPKIFEPLGDTYFKIQFNKISKEQFIKANEIINSFKNWKDIETAASISPGEGAKLPLGQKSFSPASNVELKVPNFLNAQIIMKLFKLRGDYFRALGSANYDNAFKNYGMAIMLGQKYQHGVVISHLIGIAGRTIGAKGFSSALEDGIINSSQILASYQKYINFIYSNERIYEPYEMLALDSGLPLYSNQTKERLVFAAAILNFAETETREKTTLARIRLLKAGSILKEKALQSSFPQQLPQDNSFIDPFSQGGYFLYKTDGKSANLYSLGPDKKNNNGFVSYDPTNGTMSAGDIIQIIR